LVFQDQAQRFRKKLTEKNNGKAKSIALAIPRF